LKPFVQSDGWAIQKKLKADVEPGRGHDLVRFRHNGILIFQFGIRRGSKELSHSYIPNQMKIAQKECREFRSCSVSLEQLIEMLKAKKVISDSTNKEEK